MTNTDSSLGGYNVDFDKFDDPNFNPFETKTKIVENSETSQPQNEILDQKPEESSPLKLQPEKRKIF